MAWLVRHEKNVQMASRVQGCGNKNAQVALQNCGKTSWRVLLPSFKCVLQQIRLLQVSWILTSDWIKLRGSHAIHGSYVTCCKTCLSWAGKTRNRYRCLCKKRLFSSYCNYLFVAREVDSWVAKHERPLFNSFCSNVANQVDRFCCTFYRTLTMGTMDRKHAVGAYIRGVYFSFTGR